MSTLGSSTLTHTRWYKKDLIILRHIFPTGIAHKENRGASRKYTGNRTIGYFLDLTFDTHMDIWCFVVCFVLMSSIKICLMLHFPMYFLEFPFIFDMQFWWGTYASIFFILFLYHLVLVKGRDGHNNMMF